MPGKFGQLPMDPHQLDPPTEFTSDRLFLRAYRPDDAALYFQVIRENWHHLYEFLPSNLEMLQDAAGAEAFIRWQNSEWQQRSLFIFSAWEKTLGRYIGETYLANPDWHVPSLELGYFLVQANTGKGFATEAALATTRYAFEHLQVSRLDLQCRADNLPSQRVAERCGFRPEGCQRLRHRRKDGALVDRLWYGLLRSEWQADSAAAT